MLLVVPSALRLQVWRMVGHAIRVNVAPEEVRLGRRQVLLEQGHLAGGAAHGLALGAVEARHARLAQAQLRDSSCDTNTAAYKCLSDCSRLHV